MSTRVYTDGACGADGVGGWSWLVVRDDRLVCGDMGRVEGTTNNRMELQAVIEALEWLPPGQSPVVVSDSAYVINCMVDKWWRGWIDRDWRKADGKRVKNDDLWKRLLFVASNRHDLKIDWRHVNGHNGDYFNERADELAVYARSR